MNICVLVIAEEFEKEGIAVNALWTFTSIATAAVKNLLGGESTIKHSRKPEIVADAAYIILTKLSRGFTGHFFIDEDLLIEHGITDLDKYLVESGSILYLDFFL